jgi:hypothetical protein
MSFKHLLITSAALLGLCLLVDSANAATMTVDFEWPRTRVDGSPQPITGPGKLTSVLIEYGSCKPTGELDEFDVKEGQVSVPFPQTSVSITVTAGIKCVLAWTFDDMDQKSEAPSNLGRYFPAPAPVVIKTIAGKTAYEMRELTNTNRYVAVAVGTVRSSQQCGRKIVDGYGTVTDVKLNKPLQGNVIVAKCS